MRVVQFATTPHDMGRSDQEKRAEMKDFMGLAGSGREHADASSNMQGASKHVMFMDKHTMYAVEPHASNPLHPDSFASTTSNFVDAVQYWPTVNSQWLYRNNLHTNNQANASLTFAAARRPDWSNTGGRQPYLSFSSSQEQRSVQNVNDNFANGNAMVGCISTAFNCDVPSNFSADQPRKLKVFPFLGPVRHEHTSTARVHESPTPSGRAVIPPLLVTDVSSSRILPADSSIGANGTQLTIFYAGQVNIYNDVSPIKARDIILKAAACNNLQTEKGKLDGPTAAWDHWPPNKGVLDAGKSVQSKMSDVPGPLINAAPPELLRLDLPTGQSGQSARHPIDIEHSPTGVPESPQASESFTAGDQSSYRDDEPSIPRALPQARKASLARFLEKRRERMQSRSPYLTEKSFLTLRT